ncbi:Aminotran-1-2 domain-containing protein [Fusarium sp. LHS14.1]|nr:Aminotran-1-2 domain-containing protein [Fusarium sp. LHS14.1]
MPPLPPSHRGERNVHEDLMIDLSREVDKNVYHHVKNPNGIIDLGSAVNCIMRDVLGSLVQRRLSKKQIKESKALDYNDTQGSPELLQAVASFTNLFFRCRHPLVPSNVLAANGCTSLLDSLTFSIADEGDAILVPTPSYGMFAHDLTARNGVRLVHVPCDDIPQDRFTADGPLDDSSWSSLLAHRLESCIIQERAQGSKVAAVLLANPENPLGRCYSPDVLLQVSQVCELHQVHLIVDEIYAFTGGEDFTSILSLDTAMNRENIHVSWGMSKDFGLGGLRLGFLFTYNKRLYETMRKLSMFGWVSAFSAKVSTEVLSDHDYLSRQFFPLLRKRLDARRRNVTSRLAKLGVPVVTPQAGFFIFINLSAWMKCLSIDDPKEELELKLLRHLMAHRVFLEPGQAFFSSSRGWFRLNYGAEEALLELGIRRLEHALGVLEDDGLTLCESVTDGPGGKERGNKSHTKNWVMSSFFYST